MIGDENTTTENEEQIDDNSLPKAPLEDLDVTTEEGADVQGGVKDSHDRYA